LDWKQICSFGNWEESIQHLFFDCAYAKFFWCAIHLVFRLAPRKDVNGLFNHWLKQEGHKPKIHLLIGIAAMCWVISLSRSDVVFNKYQPKIFFAGFIHGNVLATSLDTVAVQ
jgi:hypothetical protein